MIAPLTSGAFFIRFVTGWASFASQPDTFSADASLRRISQKTITMAAIAASPTIITT